MIEAGDRLAVLELHARYAHAIDSGDGEAWADCFVRDGLLRTTRPTVVRGRDDLVAFAREWHARTTAQRRHATWHHLLSVEDDGLSGVCYAAVLATTPAGVECEFTAVYRDRLIRTAAGWRLRERLVDIDREPVPTISEPPVRRADQ